MKLGLLCIIVQCMPKRGTEAKMNIVRKTLPLHSRVLIYVVLSILLHLTSLERSLSLCRSCDEISLKVEATLHDH